MALIKPDGDHRALRIESAKAAIEAAQTEDGAPFEVVVDFDISADLRAWVESQNIACGVFHDQVPDGPNRYKRETRLIVSPLKVPAVEAVEG
jgi:hypothetical protein